MAHFEATKDHQTFGPRRADPSQGKSFPVGLTGPHPVPATQAMREALRGRSPTPDVSGTTVRAASTPPRAPLDWAMSRPVELPRPAEPLAKLFEDAKTKVTEGQAKEHNPFAMPPIDTAGQPFETSIARLSMLEREVANKHGSLEQRGDAPSMPLLPHPPAPRIERAPNRSNSAAEKSRQLSRDRTSDLEDIKDMMSTLNVRMSMVEDAQTSFDKVGSHLTSELEVFSNKTMEFTKRLEVNLEHLGLDEGSRVQACGS